MLPDNDSPLHSRGDRADADRRSALDRFFAGLSECIFQSHLGVADVEMIDYLSNLLLRFVRTDALHRIRRGSGRPATEVVQMMCEAERRIGVAKREVHQHIGDFTLFWTGMYPESLRAVQGRGSADGFIDYCRQGKRSYRIAAEIEGGQERPPCELLLRLSEHFELCAYGLREVRRQWETGDGAEGILVM